MSTRLFTKDGEQPYPKAIAKLTEAEAAEARSQYVALRGRAEAAEKERGIALSKIADLQDALVTAEDALAEQSTQLDQARARIAALEESNAPETSD